MMKTTNQTTAKTTSPATMRVRVRLDVNVESFIESAANLADVDVCELNFWSALDLLIDRIGESNIYVNSEVASLTSCYASLDIVFDFDIDKTIQLQFSALGLATKTSLEVLQEGFEWIHEFEGLAVESAEPEVE